MTFAPADTAMMSADLQRFIACLSTTPALRSLTLSHNLCSFASVHKLRELIASRALAGLRELRCVAITADEGAIGHLLEVFQIAPSCCPGLKVLDVSGNPLSNAKAVAQLTRVFTPHGQLSSGWPELTTLNISSTEAVCPGVCTRTKQGFGAWMGFQACRQEMKAFGQSLLRFGRLQLHASSTWTSPTMAFDLLSTLLLAR
jgi:hypothetical protein